jgi:glycosyltransferase involved in cell wall biosynthesis
MTPGVGLRTWKEIGSINRELMPYREYLKNGWKVTILTYDRDDFPAHYEGFDIVRIPYRKLHLFALPWIHRALGKWADLIKTNQSNQAHYYTAAAKRWNKPILLRCGYVHGEYIENIFGAIPKTVRYQRKEARAFQSATHCQVTTEELSDWVSTRYGIAKDKISVVPNFVDTDTFRPMDDLEKTPFSVISVGRLSPEKQYDMLIEACSGIVNCHLTIVGEGAERSRLLSLAREIGVHLDLPGNIANDQIPRVLARNQVFALTSKWEGHPKALIEAMACGMACVGVDSPGISNVIQQGRNGILVEGNPRQLRESIRQLLESVDRRRPVEHGARRFVEENYAFQVLIDRELRIAQSLLKR